jgi:hypothetical protein
MGRMTLGRMTMGDDSDLTAVWGRFFLEGSDVDQ